MTPDAEPPLERSYPYRPGWPVACCGVFIFGVMGTVAVALLPLGYEQLRNGQLPVGVAMIVGGLFGTPMLLMAAASVSMAIRDAVRPPLLRITPSRSCYRRDFGATRAGRRRTSRRRPR